MSKVRTLYFVLLLILIVFTIIYMDNAFIFLERLLESIVVFELQRQIKPEYDNTVAYFIGKCISENHFRDRDKNYESFFH